jgi:alanyl-tRNA synthetase
MLTKKDLIKELQKNPNRYWKVKLFDDLGFKRKQCKKCRKFFWTLTDREICDDATCRPYGFIGNSPAKKPLDYFETWKVIEKFFVKNGHTSIKRYPTVCRWFPLYFTLAGIVNFYRRENGNLTFEFPANPIIQTQPCLRFNDIPNVGINSKSYSCFLMIQQSSLYDGKQGYWKDRCIELDFDLLTKVFGIKPEEIVFIEDAWIGPGAFGNSLEYYVQGLELGNAVFTEFLGTPDNFREMKEKVIDMGAGHERFCWITQGTLTSYDSVFGPVIEKLKKLCEIEYNEEFLSKYFKLVGVLDINEIRDLRLARKNIANQLKISLEELEKQVEKLEALYALADHSRTLAFAISDGGIPSNVAGGYNLRVILRRALSFIDKFKWNLKLEDIVLWHIDYLKKLFPELAEHKDEIARILEIEEKRYKQTKERATRIVERIVEKKEVLDENKLIQLYDSEGITPELLKEFGAKIEIPPDFYAKVTEKHMREKPIEEKIRFDVSEIPPTKLIFYEDPELLEFKAKILKVFDDWVVLDQTAFFPTGGGQLHDKGFIDGIEVLDVQKIGKVVIHKIKGKIPEGKLVNCKVEKERRQILRKHHTATHIVNAATRKVIGPWIFQHGAEKDVDKARLDITHFDAFTEEEIEKIEEEANKVVEKNLPVKIEVLPRGKAEQKYGFRIYQGGAIPEKNLRIVSIGNIDIEACGGLHCRSTGEVGFITILRTKRIQDGINRLEYCSGEVALKHLKEKEKVLKEVAEKLKVKEEKVPEAIKKLFEEWKKKRKEIRKLKRKT